jgi:hypothetical protein
VDRCIYQLSALLKTKGIGKGDTMKAITTIALFISLCSCSRWYDSTDCEEYVEGICVQTNNYDVTPQTISRVVDITEQEVNKVYPGLDLRALIKEHSLELEYVNNEDYVDNLSGSIDTLKLSAAVYAIGYSKIMSRMFKVSASSEKEVCYMQEWTLAHELLHFISEYHVKASEFENSNHAVQRMFIVMYRFMHSDISQSIEFRIAFIADADCKADKWSTLHK